MGLKNFLGATVSKKFRDLVMTDFIEMLFQQTSNMEHNLGTDKKNSAL